jgi:hypothetical protein
MNDAIITVYDSNGGCPHCGKNDGCFDAGRGEWFVCHEHRVIWNIFLVASSKTGEGKARGLIEGYDQIDDCLPEGDWSRDPAIRKIELEEHRRKLRAEEIEREARLRAKVDRRERITAIIIDALKIISPEIEVPDAIEVIVDGDVKIIGSKAGVATEELDIPF